MAVESMKRVVLMKLTKTITVIAGIIGCLVIIVSANQRRSPFLDREVKGRTELSPDWVGITPRLPLKPCREYQMVVLGLASPFVGEFEAKAVRLPDGSKVTPEVELVDMNGNVFPLKYGGFRGRMNIYFSNFDRLPKDREYRRVRIRSERPISCEKIFWSCYNS